VAREEGAADDHRVGDKVRLRNGGERGVVQAVRNEGLEIELTSGEMRHVYGDEVTNFSRAARRAWVVMPKRAGRPRQLNAREKRMVSLRLDVEVWRGLALAAEMGLIPSREQAVNKWLRQALAALLRDARVRAASQPGRTQAMANSERHEHPEALAQLGPAPLVRTRRSND